MRSRKQETSSPRWLLAGVQERRGGRLEAALDDLVHHLGGELLVAAGQVQGHHADAVLVALQEALAVERLQRVGGVELERAEEGLEAELLLVRAVVELADEVHRVLVEGFALVVLVLDEVVELLLEVVEEHGVVVHVLQEVLVRGLAVGLELDLAVRAVEVQHGVELVVAQALVGGRHLGFSSTAAATVPVPVCRPAALGYCCVCDSRVQNSSNPCCTRLTSSGVPMSSKRYRCGTWHLAAMMSAGHAVVVPEVRVARPDHSADQLPVPRVVQEPDDLLGHGALSPGAAVGREAPARTARWPRAVRPSGGAGSGRRRVPSFATKRSVFSEVEEK